MKFFELSSATTSLFSIALSEYILHQEDAFADRDNDYSNTLLEGILSCPITIEYLLGERKLANVQIPVMFSSTPRQTSLAQQAQYATNTLDLWLSVDGALEWLEKLRNSMFSGHILLKTTEDSLFDRTKYTNPKQYFEKWFYGPNYVNKKIDGNGRTLLHAAVEANDVRCVKYLVEERKAKIMTSYEPTPLHFACYYDKNPAIIQCLLENGGNPLLSFKLGITALSMCCNQANWIPLKIVLQHLKAKNQLSQSILISCLQDLFSTSVFECSIGGARCQRCTNDRVPHSKNMSFDKCLELLIHFGLRADDKLLKQTGRGSGFKKLHAKLVAIVNNPKNIDLVALGLATPAITDASTPSTTASTATIETQEESLDPTKLCNNCGKNEVEKQTKFKRCGQCKKVYYCSKDCQVTDWKKQHSKVCKKSVD